MCWQCFTGRRENVDARWNGEHKRTHVGFDRIAGCAFRSSRSAFRDDGGRYRSEATLAFFMVGKGSASVNASLFLPLLCAGVSQEGVWGEEEAIEWTAP